MVRWIMIGGGLVLMTASAVILYSSMIVASREDDALEKLPKWKEEKSKDKECQTDGNG